MDCFADFCVACDSESTTGPYCSQQCRLADLERARTSQPTSPTLATSPSQGYQPQWTSSTTNQGFLPTAYKFPVSTATESSSHATSRPVSMGSSDTQRMLSPSSSRTSLSSTISHSSSNSMSEQAKQELQEYSSAFHQTKSSKRRQSTW